MMVSPEEKARQAVLKERLRAAQAQRAANGPNRPLEQLARKEETLAKGSSGRSFFASFRKAAGSTREVARKNVGGGTNSTYFPTFAGPAAAAGGMAAGAGRAVQAGISSASLILIIGGLIRFIFLRGENYVGFMFSVLLFIVAGYAVSEKLEKGRLGILIPMLGFLAWDFWFNGNYDPGFLLYFLAV